MDRAILIKHIAELADNDDRNQQDVIVDSTIHTHVDSDGKLFTSYNLAYLETAFLDLAKWEVKGKGKMSKKAAAKCSKRLVSVLGITVKPYEKKEKVLLHGKWKEVNVLRFKIKNMPERADDEGIKRTRLDLSVIVNAIIVAMKDLAATTKDDGAEELHSCRWEVGAVCDLLGNAGIVVNLRKLWQEAVGTKDMAMFNAGEHLESAQEYFYPTAVDESADESIETVL